MITHLLNMAISQPASIQIISYHSILHNTSCEILCAKHFLLTHGLFKGKCLNPITNSIWEKSTSCTLSYIVHLTVPGWKPYPFKSHWGCNILATGYVSFSDTLLQLLSFKAMVFTTQQIPVSGLEIQVMSWGNNISLINLFALLAYHLL